MLGGVPEAGPSLAFATLPLPHRPSVIPGDFRHKSLLAEAVGHAETSPT